MIFSKVKSMKTNTNGFSIKSVIIIVIITSLVTSLTTAVILYNNNKVLLGTNNIKDDADLQQFLKVYNSLNKDYYADINKTEMVDSAISAMLSYLGEDYSTYMDSQETASLSNRLSGKFTGIGISISNSNVIYEVYDDTPASKAGLQANDVITNINGTSTDGLEQSAVANLINKQNENTIIVNRDGEELTFKVTPDSINTPLPNTMIQDTKIGYIAVTSFTSTVGEEFSKTLKKLEDQGMESLIIDVRDDAGGYLSGATDIANVFLKKGERIYTLEGKDGTKDYDDTTDESKDYPVVILMNENSASASEVLASALKDSYGAITVGKITYGKGRVQETKTLEDGSMVKYTSARWFTPGGVCLDGTGLTPDYIVELEKDENGNIVDTQFEKAKEVLQS